MATKAGGDSSNLKTVSVETSMGVATFKALSRHAYKRHMSEIVDGNKMDGIEGMIRESVIDPPLEEFDKWIEAQPGIISGCGAAVQKACGDGAKIIEKK